MGQRLDQRNAAELTAPFFLGFLFFFFNLPFWEQQRDRAEQAPREENLVSYTSSFNGVNSEVDLRSGRAETYYA